MSVFLILAISVYGLIWKYGHLRPSIALHIFSLFVTCISNTRIIFSCITFYLIQKTDFYGLINSSGVQIFIFYPTILRPHPPPPFWGWLLSPVGEKGAYARAHYHVYMQNLQRYCGNALRDWRRCGNSRPPSSGAVCLREVPGMKLARELY